MAIAQNGKTTEVEVYLLKPGAVIGSGWYTAPQQAMLADTPLMRDEDLILYIAPDDGKGSYRLLTKTDMHRKLLAITGSIPGNGIPFVVALGRKPVYGGLFLEGKSCDTFACITGSAFYGGIIFRPGGRSKFTRRHPDPRNDLRLMGSLMHSNRLDYEEGD